MDDREPGQFISTSSRDKEVVRLLNDLFERAAREGVSDVHIEDEDDDTRIRVRISGVMEEWAVIAKEQARNAQDKIRMRAKLQTSDNIRALDGRLSFTTEGRKVDIRVSILPTRTGHSVVCRLLDQVNAERRVEDIEMSSLVRERLRGVLAEPDGMFLISGPTGSGKTSTLYAMLNALNTPARKIVTVEDPVEYRLKGVNQVNVSEYLGFAGALRAIVRQDPDIILVGEIRDRETAQIAVQAALTGHFVLSTTHANSAAATITRMLDLGVDPFSLATVLKAVVAQRLVRRLCNDCATLAPPSQRERNWLARHEIEDVDTPLAKRLGCPSCGGTGYSGRVPVFEMIAQQAPVIEAVEAKASAAEIQRLAAGQSWFQTLAQAGVGLCREGKTPFSEIVRIAGENDYLHVDAEEAYVA